MERVAPGQILTNDLTFMRGHGTFIENEQLVASVAGTVERVNKLISVKPAKTRFNGEIGDVVVGRIIELGSKRWKVDIKGRQDAVLLLSAINLPGGVQRRKTESDELEMRNYFAEGDLLSAEVQAFFGDGACSLHTRNIKYGKLRNGSLVIVPSALVKRSKSHFITLSCGVDLVLGLNGYIWVSKHVFISPELLNEPEGLYSNQNDEIEISERELIARVCNLVTCLANEKAFIDETILVFMLELAQDYKTTEILVPEIQKELVELAIEFNIIKQVIELAQQSLAGRQVHLVSILRALEAMQSKNIITDKQFDLLKLVLMILEKLLPNQSWDSKVSFLESSMIQDQGYICDVHQQNLVPLLTTPGFETASVNESFETESIAEQSRLFLERKALDWRKYIRASKQDRNWILSEWIAATKFWRQRMLKIRFQKWKKAACRISVAQSYRVTSLAKFAFQKWFENVVSSQRQKKKLALRCWRESVKKEKLELVQYQKSQSLKIHFDQWRLKSWYKTIFTPYATECIEQIQSRQRLESLTYYFGIWYAEHTGYHAQYRKLLRLNRTMELGKLSSFFERWKKSTELSLLRRRFQFIVNLNQKRAYFDQWVKLLKDSFEMKRNQSIRKVWFYKMWGRVEKGFEIQTFQKEFEIPIQQRYFYNWIVQLNKSRDFEQALDFASMMLVNSASRLFLLWIRLSKLYQQKKVWNTRMLKLKFEKWIGKSRKIRENSVIGTYGLYQTKLVTFSFQKWFVQVKTSREHERGLYLRYIWKKWRLNCNRNLKEQVLYSKWVEFKSHYVFAKWRQALVVKQLEQIHKKSKLRNLFVKWRYKAKDQFAARLYCYSTLVWSFQEWNHASHEVQSAKYFKKISLMKRCFEVWSSKALDHLLDASDGRGSVDRPNDQRILRKGMKVWKVALDVQKSKMVMQTNRKARMFKKWTRRLYLLQDVRVIADEYCNFRLLKMVWGRWSSYLEVKRVVVETDDNEIKDGLHVEMLSDASKGKGIDKEADVEEEDAILDTQKLVEGTVAKIESEEAIIDVEASFRKPVIELELKDAILVDQDHVGEEEPSDAILDAKEELVQDPAAEAENKQEIPKVGIPEIQDPVQEPVVQVGEDTQQPTDFVVQTEPDSGIPDSQESFKELLAVGELYHSFSVQKRSFKHWYLFKKQLQTNDLASSFHVFKSKVACIKRWMQLYQYRFEMQCLAEDLNMFNTQKMVLRKLIRLVGFREDLEDTASLFHEFSVMKKGWRSWLLKSKSMGRFMEIAVQLHVMQRQLVYFHYWTDQLHSVKAKSNLIAHLQIVDDKPLVEPETDTASSAEEQVAALFDVFQTLKRNFKLWKQKLDKSKQIHLLATKWSVQLVLKRSFDHWSFIAIEHHDVKFGELCYRKHLVRKYWNEWISSQIMLEKATRANNKWLLNRYYRNWNQSVNFSIANRFDQFRMSISCVRRWKERYEIRLANFEEAVDLHREFLVLRMFHHWYKTCAYVLKQELEAIQVYDSNLLLKCYSAWNTVVKEPSFVPLYHYRTYFSAWKESSRRTRLAVELQENQAQKRYLLKWQARLYKKNKLLKQMKSLQAGVKRFRALKTKQVFKIWGTLLLEKMLREKKWIDSLTRVWNVWSYKASGLALIKLKRNASLQKSSFKKWLTKKDTFVARSVKGIEFDKQRCYKKVMQTWKVQYFVSRSRTSVLKSAMLQWQRMYLKKVKFRMIKDHMEKKIAKRSLMKRFIKWKSLLVKQPPLSAKKYFCKWKARTSRIKEKQEMIKLYWNRWKSQFQKETFHTTRKVIFAETWHEKQLLRKVLKGWMSTNGKEPVQLVHTSRSFSLGGSLYITKI